jgi:RimJ/RimL family protein N-acetyltransferase
VQDAGVLTATDGDVRIREVRSSDLDLYLALRGDAGTMRDLGGPQPADRISGSHAREVAEVAAGRAWIVVAEVRTEDGWQPAGNVSLVRHTAPEGTTSELGWMVLPAHRGRGVAGAAVRLLLGLPGAASAWGAVEAFPSTTNAASNRLCAGLGFLDLGEVELEFAGQRFTCTRWRLEPPYRGAAGSVRA